MDYLITHRIPATFFMSGKWMAKHESEWNSFWASIFRKSHAW